MLGQQRIALGQQDFRCMGLGLGIGRRDDLGQHYDVGCRRGRSVCRTIQPCRLLEVGRSGRALREGPFQHQVQGCAFRRMGRAGRQEPRQAQPLRVVGDWVVRWRRGGLGRGGFGRRWRGGRVWTGLTVLTGLT